jgi:hypothetical protein
MRQNAVATGPVSLTLTNSPAVAIAVAPVSSAASATPPRRAGALSG